MTSHKITIPHKRYTKSDLNIIQISGVEGDKVNLHLDGFIYTKYGDFCLIKSVDKEKEIIDTYLHGQFHFCRVSHSAKKNKKTLQSCVEYIESFCNRYIRKGCIMNYNNQEHTIVDIIFPDFVNSFDISIITDKTTIIVDNKHLVYEISLGLIYTPKSKRERLSDMMNQHARYDNTVQITDDLLNEIEKLYNE
jgi:hypothetical protein